MFVKRSVKPPLVETYDEAEKIEAELESVNKHSMESETRPFNGKKPLLLIRPKDEHSHELESVVKMVQNLSNKLVDLEKDKEVNSGRTQYKPFFKKRDESGPSQPPTHNPSVMNLTEFGMENLFTFHQQPHSEKNFPQ